MQDHGDKSQRRLGQGPPKTRLSCDGCGAAKLKCDRAQPECERCVAHGIACVYGLSRKMGKPPRHKTQVGPSAIRTPSGTSGSATVMDNGDKSDRHPSSASGSGAIDDAMPDFVRRSSSLTDVPSVWDPLDDSANSFTISLEDLGQPVPLTTFSTHDIWGWSLADLSNDSSLAANLPFSPTSTPTSPVDVSSSTLRTRVSSTSQPTAQAHQSQADKGSHPDSASVIPLARIPSHDCPREAYELLGSLSFHDHSSNSYSVPPSAEAIVSSSSSSSMTAGAAVGSTANRVPLDQVLRLNREATEQVGHLLACPCSRSPNLALLYASIVSRVLIWYQQAATRMQNASCSQQLLHREASSDTMMPDDQSLASSFVTPTDSPPDSDLLSASYGSASAALGNGSLSAWQPSISMAAVNSSSTLSPATSGGGGKSRAALLAQQSSPSTVSVVPARMAVGTFSVDDLYVQNALEIQLLLGEMRRVGRLIDQFTTAHDPASAGQPAAATSESTYSSVDTLYQNLYSWLRGEHLRITNIIRSRLRELNT